MVVVWAMTGPTLGFSTTWQLVINTVTTNRDLPDGIPHAEYPVS
jgi:hypothetical protein